MPKKKLISIRISELTARQITDLIDRTGDTQTSIVTIAIDRLWNQMIEKEIEMEYYILHRLRGDAEDGVNEYQVVSCIKGGNPLWGYGSWNLCDGPFRSYGEADNFFDTIYPTADGIVKDE